MNRKCKNDRNRFCNICGKVTMSDRQTTITEFVKKRYYDYFGIKLRQNKPFAPQKCCKTCVENLRRWSNKKIEHLPFGVPMIWTEGRDHTSDCYFCMTNLEGINRRNKQHVKYPDIPSAKKPVPHGPSIPIPKPPADLDSISIPSTDEELEGDDVSATYQPTDETSHPKLLSQAELNDLTRDLGLSKESAQLLGSRLHENHLLTPETTFFWYRSRKKEFKQYFTLNEESSLVYCNNINGLSEALDLHYDPAE